MLASRLYIAVPAVLVLGMGCTGEIDADLPKGITPAQEAARSAWVTNVQPVLEANCASCHAGSRPEVAWFEGADVNAQKEDLLTYRTAAMASIVSLTAPQTSMLVKKGAHEGPALTASQASGILDWLQKEREASPTDGAFPVMLAPIAAMLCTGGAPGDPTCPYNVFPLDEAGAAGAKIEFTASNLSGALYVASLKVIPGPGGVYIEHPVFVSVPLMGEPKLDPLDRYFNITINLPPNAPVAEQTIGNGTASFPDFPPADPLTIYFKSVGPMM